MSFIKGKTTEGKDFIFDADCIECIEEFDYGTGKEGHIGVIITMKSGKWFRTATYDLLGIQDVLKI